jgi:hypothetical protein
MIAILWRNKLLTFCLIMGISVGSLFVLSLIYSNYYGHMRNDEALNPFQTSLPLMPAGTIPVDGGIEVLRKSDPKGLSNPLPVTQAVLDQGRKAYLYYCVQCHGPQLDGKATVGQSFFPLPDDLLASPTQALSDGELFFNISLGFKRMPPMYATLTAEDRWAILRYVRTLAEEKKKLRKSG